MDVVRECDGKSRKLAYQTLRNLNLSSDLTAELTAIIKSDSSLSSSRPEGPELGAMRRETIVPEAPSRRESMVPESPDNLEDHVTPRNFTDSRKSPNMSSRDLAPQEVMFKVPSVPIKSLDSSQSTKSSSSLSEHSSVDRTNSMESTKVRQPSFTDRILAPLSARSSKKLEGSGAGTGSGGGVENDPLAGLSEKDRKKREKEIEKAKKEKEKGDKKWQKQLEQEEKQREKDAKKAAKK